jgi:hypothetical protein
MVGATTRLEFVDSLPRIACVAYFLVGLGSEGLPGVGAGTDIGPPLSTKNVTNIRACRAEGLVDL